MTVVTETAYAKINLALHVRARRHDGYHEIESLFAFLDDGDRIAIEPAETLLLSISGPFADALGADDDNLVLRAARAMKAWFDVAPGAHIRLEKRLPIAAGLGGGSTDAAATARALNTFWNLGADEETLARIVGSLGADVPACIAARTAIGRGIGDVLEPVDMAAVSGVPVLLVNPMKPCPTGPVYREWDGADRGSIAVHRSAWRNDLTAGAVALVPEIGMVLYLLTQAHGTGQVAMSGSGATCFALFDTEAARDEACAEIAQMQPGWWVMAGRLR